MGFMYPSRICTTSVSEDLVAFGQEPLFDNTQQLSVYYMTIEWDGRALSWRRLLDDVIGHEEPTIASINSIRGHAYREWASLGLANQPNSAHRNCVSVSESAFVGMVERLLRQPNLNLSSEEVSLLMSVILSMLCRIYTLYTSWGVTNHVLEKWLGNPEGSLRPYVWVRC